MVPRDVLDHRRAPGRAADNARATAARRRLGTGGFLRWALDRGSFASAAGVDISSAAIELARGSLPQVDLRTAPLKSLPFEDGSFELVVSNDVLQHVPEQELAESLGELRRVLAADGTLLLRTNGALRAQRERDDWRRYDRKTLSVQLQAAGFACERLTYANTLLSFYGTLRGRSPHAPTEHEAGIPRDEPSRFGSLVGRQVLTAEAWWLARLSRSLPYGHTLFALASPS